MDDRACAFASALQGSVKPGRYGRRAGAPGVTVREIRPAGLATVTARKDRRSVLVDAARSAFGVELPSLPRRVEGRGLAFIWSGPDRWVALAQGPVTGGMEALLGQPFAGLASVVDQSHAWTTLRIAGPRVRDALAKGLAIDLHPRAFKTGHAAVTAVAHVGVHLWQIDDAPGYEVLVPRGFTGSFWHWLEASVAEYGLELVGAPDAGTR